MIVFFTAGYSGKRFIFEKAHELGAWSICLLLSRAFHVLLTASKASAPRRAQAEQFNRSAGVRTVVIDGPDSWAKSMVTDGIAERFLPIDMRDPDAVFDKALAAIKVSSRPRHQHTARACPGALQKCSSFGKRSSGGTLLASAAAASSTCRIPSHRRFSSSTPAPDGPFWHCVACSLTQPHVRHLLSPPFTGDGG